MNIYVDGMFFRLSGIGRVYENILMALVDSPDVRRIYTVVPLIQRDIFIQSIRSEKTIVRFVPFSHLSVGDFLRKGIVIGGFSPAPDLCFFPHFNVPFFLEGKIVSTIHDLIPVSRFSDWPIHRKAAYRFLVGRCVRVSNKTVCVSEFTRRQLTEMFAVPPDRCSVIYSWLDDRFQDEERVGEHRPMMVEGDYLLFVGNRFPHKNLKNLLEAYRLILPEFPLLKFVVVGARKRPMDEVDAAASDPAMEGRVIQYDRAADEEVMALYSHARVFVFPSFMEGFGIPCLEALSFGIPVVCSDIPVFREVCGDAVRYADPFDPLSFAREIRAALMDPQRNAILKRRGEEHIRTYRKENGWEKYRDLFRSCLDIGPER